MKLAYVLANNFIKTYWYILAVCIKRSVVSIEEDSEPILGLWFEETLAPSDETSTNTNKETNNEASAERTTTTTIVPDNREPHGVRFFFQELFYQKI